MKNKLLIAMIVIIYLLDLGLVVPFVMYITSIVNGFSLQMLFPIIFIGFVEAISISGLRNLIGVLHESKKFSQTPKAPNPEP